MVASPWASPLLTDVFLCTCIALCITQSAIFSGLNLAIFSISKLRLEVAPSTTSSALDCASSPCRAMPTCCSLPARSPATCARRWSAPTSRRRTQSGRSRAALRGRRRHIRRQLRGRGRSQYRRSRRSSYKRLSAAAAATAGGTSGAPRNAMFNLAPCLTVTTDFVRRYHKHPRPILRLTHRAPARGALHGHLDALSTKA
jgi:hypothetical protein